MRAGDYLEPGKKYLFDLIAVREVGLTSPAVCGYIVDQGDGDILDIQLFGVAGFNVWLSLEVKPHGEVILTKEVRHSETDQLVGDKQTLHIFPDEKMSKAIRELPE